MRIVALFLAVCATSLVRPAAAHAELGGGPGHQLDQDPGPGSEGPTLEHLGLELRLDPPDAAAGRAHGELHGNAILVLAGVTRERVSLLLNRELEVTSVSASGRELRYQHGFRNPFSSYHREGRTVVVDLGAAPTEGRLELEVAYSGRGESGVEGSDWRGILFIDADQVRMSEQTIFYPQFPLDLDGPGIQRSSVDVRLDLPAALEAYVPAPLASAPSSPAGGRRVWRFAGDRPTVLSVLAGAYRRFERTEQGAELTLLLREEHAGLSEELSTEVGAALGFFASKYGDLNGGVLGIVEIACRKGTSINWASQGVATFDRGAFGNGVPLASVAHEVAHLWWGQEVAASGPGERFLTESLAEYAAWRFLESRAGAARARESIEGATARYLRAADRGQDAALAEVTFRTPGYSALAYAKGPLVLRHLELALGRERMDRALRAYAGGEDATLEGFLSCLAADGALRTAHLAWFHQAGHPRFALDAVERTEDGRVVGEVLAEGWAAQVGALVDVELSTVRGLERVALELAGGRTALELRPGSDALALTLDPDRSWPGARGEVVVFDGPTLVSSEPDGQTGDVPCGGMRITLVFDRNLAPLDRERFAAAQRRIDGRAPSVVDYEQTGSRLVLRTKPWRPNTEYTLSLAGIHDDRGAPVEGLFRFRTAGPLETAAPTVVSTSPENGARGVSRELGEIRINFDEPMDAARGFRTTLLRELESEGLHFPSIRKLFWSEDARTLVCQVERLEPGTRYVLPIRSTHYRDVSGNRVVDFDLVFETAAD